MLHLIFSPVSVNHAHVSHQDPVKYWCYHFYFVSGMKWTIHIPPPLTQITMIYLLQYQMADFYSTAKQNLSIYNTFYNVKSSLLGSNWSVANFCDQSFQVIVSCLLSSDTNFFWITWYFLPLYKYAMSGVTLFAIQFKAFKFNKHRQVMLKSVTSYQRHENRQAVVKKNWQCFAFFKQAIIYCLFF